MFRKFLALFQRDPPPPSAYEAMMTDMRKRQVAMALHSASRRGHLAREIDRLKRNKKRHSHLVAELDRLNGA